MTKKTLIAFFSLVAFLSVFFTGCSPASNLVTPTPYPTLVRKTYAVGKGDIVINAEFFGQVAPKSFNTAYFQMSGHVGEAYVQVNDVVKKGQLLADLTEYKDMQATAITTRDAILRAQINLQIEQLTLEKFKAENRPSYEIQIQEKQIELAQIDLNEILVKYGIDPSSNALDALDAQVAKAKLFAPVDGVIISGVNVGRSVSPTTPAFLIGDGKQLEIVINLGASDSSEQLKDMFEGMPVAVSPNDKPDVKWAGKITQLPSPYGTGDANDQTIHIVLDESPAAADYKSGDTVTVLVQLANKTGVLWLPPAAIRQVGGRTFVIVNGDNGPRRIDIEIGLKTNDKIEIITGLSEGQVVVGP
jgi:macrolide-specific efflux system membrane fusion protein